MLSFKVIHKDPLSAARAGLMTTAHGTIDTPVFMPVGTAGTVKAVTTDQLQSDIGALIILSNTYHLYLRPGMQVLEAAGGLHRFMGWDRAILTDSGGYQVFSLAAQRKVSREGVLFRSHIDGSEHLFTPEKVIDAQRSIGADIIMAFDECLSHPASFEQTKQSMELTHHWLDRCLHRMEETSYQYGSEQHLFPIVQGGMESDLRRISAAYITEKDCAGNAIGGLSVGEPEEKMYELTSLVCGLLPREKPRYLMGVGTPWNLLENLALGVDMFDCVMPTRNGRNGMLFTTQGIINIRNKKWEMDFDPIDEGTVCFASRNFSRSYLRHLFIGGEILGMQLASIHNLAFYAQLMKLSRSHIIQGDFDSWKKSVIPLLKQKM
jgi:queuine tRNA-ribosyltransferase